MVVAVGVWADLAVPIILAAAGTALAALWPSLQSWRRRRRLTALIRRELREISPLEPIHGRDWWEHLGHRFIHEEFFRRENVIANRDFLLSLPPTLVYHASQLWLAYEAKDLNEWRYHLRRLLVDEEIGKQLATTEARVALEKWDKFELAGDGAAAAVGGGG